MAKPKMPMMAEEERFAGVAEAAERGNVKPKTKKRRKPKSKTPPTTTAFQGEDKYKSY